MNAAFEREKSANGGESDLEDIRRSGELIVATISGPETYYDYHGAGLGLQYALADDFARSEGLKERVELANDTTELLAMVKRGDADVAALPVGEERIKEAGWRERREAAYELGCAPPRRRAGRSPARLVYVQYAGRSTGGGEKTLARGARSAQTHASCLPFA